MSLCDNYRCHFYRRQSERVPAVAVIGATGVAVTLTLCLMGDNGFG